MLMSQAGPPVGPLTPKRTRTLCTLERASTPGGTARSPVRFVQESTPTGESGSARKRRRDRNRQAARYAGIKAARPAKKRLSALERERCIVESIDREQPERSFDMDELETEIIHAQYSLLQDRRAAAAMLRECDGAVEERIGAAVHLMVGRRWTAAGKELVRCSACGRRFAVRADGLLRRHSCV